MFSVLYTWLWHEVVLSHSDNARQVSDLWPCGLYWPLSREENDRQSLCRGVSASERKRPKSFSIIPVLSSLPHRRHILPSFLLRHWFFTNPRVLRMFCVLDRRFLFQGCSWPKIRGGWYVYYKKKIALRLSCSTFHTIAMEWSKRMQVCIVAPVLRKIKLRVRIPSLRFIRIICLFPSGRHRAFKDYWASNAHLTSNWTRTCIRFLKIQVKCLALCTTPVMLPYTFIRVRSNQSATLQQRLSKALANAKQSTMLQHVTSDWDTTPVCYGKA